MEEIKSRRAQLLSIVGDDPFLINEVDELLFLEEKLEELRKLPHIEINPRNPAQQRATVAAKEYIKYLQQYNNIVKILSRATGADDADEESPLRKWARSRQQEE